MIKPYLTEVKIVFGILSKKIKKRMRLMLVMLSISGFLESLTIGLFIPLIGIILEKKTNYPVLNNFYDYSEIEINDLLIIIVCIILVVYLIKSIFLTFLEFGIQKMINTIKAELTSTLFQKYVNAPYKFHLKNNSSILLRNLTTEISAFCYGIIEPILMLAKEFFIIIFLVTLLFIFDYRISIFAFLFGLTLIISVKIILKKLLYRLGKEAMNYRGETNKIILEALQGIKFIKSYKIESNFIERLLKNLYSVAKIKGKETAITSMPRIWIELVVLVILAILGFCFFVLDLPMVSYLSFISLFLIAMLKMLPSFLSLIRTVNSYQSHKPSIDFIKKEFDEITALNEKQERNSINEVLKFDKKFIIKNISFKYHEQKQNIIDNLSLTINKQNELICIYGDSGVGKTTLIDILIGLHSPHEGEFYLDNKLVNQKTLRGKIFGYVPQNIYLFDDTIKNNILIKNDIKISDDHYNKVLSQCDLSEFIDSLPDKDKTFIGENGAQISGGQRQRIGLARALVNEAKILVLDEATSALDNETEQAVMDAVNNLNKNITVILIAHRLNTVKNCNIIFKLEKGQIIKQEAAE